MRKANRSVMLGTSGEQEVKTQLERALQATGFPLSGAHDRGIDLAVQFPSPKDGEPLYLGVQVKTGLSFAKSKKKHWIIQNVKKRDLEAWKRSQLPVVFVWVRPGPPIECYWRLIKRKTRTEPFRLSKQATVTPMMRFDLPLHLLALEDPPPAKTIDLLRPSLATGIRPYAKDYYRYELMGEDAIHPVLGAIRFTWRGWKHITGRRRATGQIADSLSLLGAARWAIEHPESLVAMRRLGQTTRGRLTTATRLLIYDSYRVGLGFRGEIPMRYIIRESITFPSNWQELLLLPDAIHRSLSFESIYPKPTRKSHASGE